MGASGKSSPASDREAVRAVPAALAAIAATAVLLSCATTGEAPPGPQAVEEAAPHVVVSWQITPTDGYQDERSFVRLDFVPCRLGQDAPGEEGPPPGPGGRLTVHLGYRSLVDANTVWYSFEITEGGRTLLRQDGAFDVPNIKGPDGYWWNDVSLDLPREVAGEALVVVSDKRSDTAREFVLRRVESAEEIPGAAP
jgi:hypothetical protein